MCRIDLAIDLRKTASFPVADFLLGGPSYKTSIPYSLDVVMCCVAVCYPQTWKCLAVDPFVEVGVSLLGSSLPAGLQGLLIYCAGLRRFEMSPHHSVVPVSLMSAVQDAK